jgi:hypothetical protein
MAQAWREKRWKFLMCECGEALKSLARSIARICTSVISILVLQRTRRSRVIRLPIEGGFSKQFKPYPRPHVRLRMGTPAS